MSQVVILNAGGQQVLGEVTVQHAIGMLHRQVARVHEAVPGATIGPYPVPRSVELERWIYTKWVWEATGTLVCSRANVLRRDRWTCAYCGRTGNTWDHIVPRSRGGRSTWTNTVAACLACNGLKADRTPEEAGMQLQFRPHVPTLAELRPAKYR
ncbi:MAG: HNH endonuclease [Propionicimonas sp.]